MKENPTCFTGKLFSVANKHYFYNTISGEIEPVTKTVASILNNYRNSHGGCDIPRDNPKAKDVRPIIKNPYNDAVINKTLNSKLRLLVLELTAKCNMSCDYCISGQAYDQKDGVTALNMKEKTAIQGVDYLLNHSADQELPLAISFYGGEPLLRFPIIVKVAEYAVHEAKRKNREIVFSITTNGTLLDKDIIEFFVKHAFQIVISLDGPKTIHDRYRKYHHGGGTFDVVFNKLKLIKETDPEYFKKYVRCSTVLTSHQDFTETETFLNNLGVKLLINHVDSYGLNLNTNKTQNNDYLPTLENKLLSCIKSDGVEILNDSSGERNFLISYMKPMLKRFIAPKPSSHYMSLGQCILGASRLYLSSDNYYYPCEKLAGHSIARIGKIETGIDQNKVINLINQFYELAKVKCAGCWMSSKCSTCLALVCSGDYLDKKKFNHYCSGSKVWGLSALRIVSQVKHT
ncbi:MAG: radical SAM protein [Paludibacter sp.]|nr:radical SAM protein [Paludibacter sp.]MDD4198694.1 radical SAM protein [Paludibacter sp.]MDD4427112.1 radical SAM protein [Paludibacter sp.]